MKTTVLLLLTLPLLAQNYTGYNNQPVSRMSFLRHQFKPSQNALQDRSLIGYWPLNEGAGAVAYDESGNGNHGAWSGAPSGTNSYYSAGKTSQLGGFFLYSAPNVIQLTSAFSISTPLTYVAWINCLGFTAAHAFIGAVDQVGTKVAGNTGGVILARLYSGGTVISSGTISTNLWHLMAVSRDAAGNVVVYLDGVSVGTASAQNGASSPFYLGGTAAIVAQEWAGLLQGVRFYNRALSQKEIQAIYNAENH